MRNGATCMFSGLTTAKQPITPSMWGWVLLKVTVLLEKLTLHKQWTEAPSHQKANMCPCVRLIHPDNQTAGTNQYVTGYIFNTIYFAKLFIHYLENIDKPVILIFYLCASHLSGARYPVMKYTRSHFCHISLSYAFCHKTNWWLIERRHAAENTLTFPRR